MHKSTRSGLIGLGILLCAAIVILLINLEIINPDPSADCLRYEKESTCYSLNPKPYRYYGTKTTYKDAVGNYTDDSNLPVENCTAKVFYLLSRHATRYPDREEIEQMIDLLPALKIKIMNSEFKEDKFCDEDLDRLQRWNMTLVPGNDNKLSATGEAEAEGLAKRFKERFPSILDQSYSPEKFVFEYTSRERTRTTAEAFAKGLFNDDAKRINFDNKTNDGVLVFHRICKPLKKKCKDPSYDISEIKNVERGELIADVVKRVSEKAGFTLTRDEVEVIYRACVFGYALQTDDIWCSLFTDADLKILEFEGDIDDYYKDAYGNKINYEQACPVAKHLVDLFKSSVDLKETKSVLHFSHAGAIKKVYPMFGLFKDELPLTADAFCSERDRKWRSSLIAPFNSNIAFILYKCMGDYKVAAFHNEKAVQIMGCKDKLCSFKDFHDVYDIIGTECNLNKICCTCCKD